MKSTVAYLAGAALVLLSFETMASRLLADAARERDYAVVTQILSHGDFSPDATGTFGTPALHWLVRYNNTALVRELIAGGADVNFPNRYGVLPLELAIEQDSSAMTELLIASGANVNLPATEQETLLIKAARGGNSELVSLLLDAGAEVDGRDGYFSQTPLMVAARENHEAVVELLLAHGADVNAFSDAGETPAFRPPGAGGGSHGDGIVRGGWPEQGMRNPTPGQLSPLLYAVRDGHVEIAEMLLQAGADVNAVNANDTSALILAIMNNNMEVAHLLLDAGAEINHADWYGQTALWSAVDVRNMDVNSNTLNNGVDRDAAMILIERLLDKGADPNARTRQVLPLRRWLMPLGSLSWVDFTGQTPFLRAALSGDINVMSLLVENGADPRIPTFGGTTALMAAAGVNWVVNQTYDEGDESLLAAVNYCIELGLDANAHNSMGLTALHGAANRGSNEIIKTLYAQGADMQAVDNEGRSAMVWAEGVFLATHAPVPKPETMALLRQLEQ